MKTSLFLLLLLAAPLASAQDLVTKATQPESWLSAEARKLGLVTSWSLSQALSGAVDAYHFGGADCRTISKDNYHIFRTGRDAAWIGTGWFSYAEIRSNQKWYKKAAHFAGASLLARNAFEWSYKTCRYGNPFDYTEAHNKHALVYIKFEGGIPKDAYIGLGPLSGPAVDLTCVALGVWLLGR